MMMKNPPLEQTGGPKEVGQEGNPLLPVLQVKRQPRQQGQIRTIVSKSLQTRSLKRCPSMNKQKEVVQHLLIGFKYLRRTTFSDHAWNTSVPAIHETVQPWRSTKAQTEIRRDQNPEGRQFRWSATATTKARQFYAFATLRESARDVYSKRRIIAVTKVEIVEWHDYKHLDWITVRRDDDVLYQVQGRRTFTE
ncbi:hypothetical protein Tco_0471483 [Tanacetum coccineum]|uniref:Uncharacterized protein n=1 Tax=Tanacetum coccineum TaxID=301880 RepID=A0ABQ5HFZ5_9ASTR